MIAWLAAAIGAAASVSGAMRSDIPDAHYIRRYTPAERAEAAQHVLRLSASPKLGAPVPLTPDQPYAADGSRLEFWKPAFVLATPEGGEAGINFWGLHNQGHVNVGFTPDKARTRLLDCRILSPGPVHYKFYNGQDTPVAEGDIVPAGGHVFLQVASTPARRPVLVELWPQKDTAVIGFFGCDLSEVGS